MEIISLDENRVKILEKVVEKKSSKEELSSLILARNIALDMQKIIIAGKTYKLNVPKVYDYNNSIITMEKCFGQNLELMLRTASTHTIGAQYTNILLSQFIDSSFYWHDFAPRNILISDDVVSIMDFERGLSTTYNLSLYLLNNVYEEYSSFLLPNERVFDLQNIVENDKMMEISVDNLTSKRVKKICQMIYGNKQVISLKEYFMALNIILSAEKPFIKNGEIIYPILELEDYVTRYGREKYVKKVVKKYYGKHN